MVPKDFFTVGAWTRRSLTRFLALFLMGICKLCGILFTFSLARATPPTIGHTLKPPDRVERAHSCFPKVLIVVAEDSASLPSKKHRANRFAPLPLAARNDTSSHSRGLAPSSPSFRYIRRAQRAESAEAAGSLQPLSRCRKPAPAFVRSMRCSWSSSQTIACCPAYAGDHVPGAIFGWEEMRDSPDAQHAEQQTIKVRQVSSPVIPQGSVPQGRSRRTCCYSARVRRSPRLSGRT